MNFSAVPWHVCAPLSHGSSTVDAVFRFVNNFAEQQIALSQVSFSAIGIIHSDPKGGAATVGPMITWNGFGRPEPPWFLGPFKTNRERFLENIHVNMELIEEHDPVAAYLAQLEAKGSWSREVRNWKRKKAISTSSTRMTRPINFSPRTTNHVNIDWEWAYVATKAEAFTTPSALYFGKPNFRDGINGLTLDVELLIEAYDRLGRPDLAECVRRGRKYQRMNEVLGGRPDLAQLNGLSEAFLGDKAGEPSKTLDAWKERAMERYGGDEGSKRVMRLSLG